MTCSAFASYNMTETASLGTALFALLLLSQNFISYAYPTYDVCRGDGRDAPKCGHRRGLNFYPITINSARAQCTDARDLAAVVDFTCNFRYADAFYHRLIDCAVPNFGLVDLVRELMSNGTKDIKLIVPSSQRDVVFQVLDKTLLKQLYPKECILIAPETQVFYEKRPTTLPRLLLQDMAERFHQAALRDLEPATAASYTILFIERHGTRELRPIVKAYLQKMLPDFRFSVFNGYESFEDTVRKFANAFVVFGFHGAATANMLFAPRNAIVVELTFFEDAKDEDIWRSNRAALQKLRPSIIWLTHGIDIEVAHVPHAEDIKQHKLRDADHFLKRQRLFDIPLSDLHNIAITIVELHRWMNLSNNTVQ